jgi:chemotaxis protein histidine kinase CheA
MTLNSDLYSFQQLGQLLQPAACPQVHNSDPNTSIKQALAIAIVRHKRRANQEAEEWRAKAQRLEAQLLEQTAGNTALKAWATSIFNNSSSSANATAGGQRPQRGRRLAKNIVHDSPAEQASPAAASAGIFLPPLTLPTSGAAAACPGDCPYSCNTASGAPALQDSYQALHQQLLLTAQASSTCGAASSVLNGKAASLSDMLLTNMRMLLRLQQLGNGSTTPNPSSASNSTVAVPQALGAMSGGLQDSWPTETITTLSSFITGTLLQVPGSSLQRAYMQQCAALLAALLAHLPATQPQPEQEQQKPAEAGRPLQQQLHKQQKASQASTVAVQAVNLMQQLLTEKVAANSSSTSNTSSATAAAASAMLQQLSTFPSTALLLALAVAQQLQRLVQQLQQANAAASAVQLGRGFSFAQLQQSSKALAVAAELFEASYGLLEELVRLAACAVELILRLQHRVALPYLAQQYTCVSQQ